MGHYVIYNVSGRQYHSTKFSARVVEGNWSGKKSSTLGALYNLACSIYDYLIKDPKNIVAVHCMVSKRNLKAIDLFAICEFLKLFCYKCTDFRIGLLKNARLEFHILRAIQMCNINVAREVLPSHFMPVFLYFNALICFFFIF